VERIRRILALLDQGMSPSQAGAALEAEHAARREDDNAGWEGLSKRLLEGIIRFDEAIIDRVYSDALSAHPLNQVIENLTIPMMQQLGERWESGEGMVAEEHFFRDYVRNALGSQLFHRPRPRAGSTIVTACIPDEEHDIGLLLCPSPSRAGRWSC